MLHFLKSCDLLFIEMNLTSNVMYLTHGYRIWPKPSFTAEYVEGFSDD